MNIASVDILDEDKLERKHHVLPYEVEEVLLESPRISFVEKGNVRGEDMYLALGRTEEGRYLAVFFVFKRDRTALAVSARDMDSTERKRYGKK